MRDEEADREVGHRAREPEHRNRKRQNHVSDDGGNAQVRGALTVSPEMLAFIRAYGKGA